MRPSWAGSSHAATPLEAAGAGCHNRAQWHGATMSKQMSEGQRAYEAKRAAKAGMSVEKWLDAKDRDKREEERAREKAEKKAEPKKPGLFSRLLDRAHKPL